MRVSLFLQVCMLLTLAACGKGIKVAKGKGAANVLDPSGQADQTSSKTTAAPQSGTSGSGVLVVETRYPIEPSPTPIAVPAPTPVAVDPVSIQVFGPTRAWGNGTFAMSCDGYRNPQQPPYTYAGATGDGVYRILMASGFTQDVYCDMTTEGGGWTFVTNASEPTTNFQKSAFLQPSINFDISETLKDWQYTKKLVKINNSRVLGVFSQYGSNKWSSDELRLHARFSNFWLGSGHSVWTVQYAAVEDIGAPNGGGGWCYRDGAMNLFMIDVMPYYTNGWSPGIQAFQGGCNSASYNKTDFSWQVYSK